MMQATEDDVFVNDAMVEFFPHQAIQDLTMSELSFLLMQAIRLKREQEATYDA